MFKYHDGIFKRTEKEIVAMDGVSRGIQEAVFESEAKKRSTLEVF